MRNKENIPLYIKQKFSELHRSNQTLESVFNIIHNQDERIFSEYYEAFTIRNVTYHEFKSYVKKCAQYLRNQGISGNHQYIGLMMDNSLNWVAMFWAILMIGGKPVLLNKKLPLSFNVDIIKLLQIEKTICDVKYKNTFPFFFFYLVKISDLFNNLILIFKIERSWEGVFIFYIAYGFFNM